MSEAMGVVETLIFASAWQILAQRMFGLMITPQKVIDAAIEVIRTDPLTREEFMAFEARLFGGGQTP